MIPKNVVNSEKKSKVEGNIFHLFYSDLHTSILFDRNLVAPIIFGSKAVVMGVLKKIDELMNVKPITKVKIYSYIISTDGYRRVNTYEGPISGIGKYILRY